MTKENEEKIVQFEQETGIAVSIRHGGVYFHFPAGTWDAREIMQRIQALLSDIDLREANFRGNQENGVVLCNIAQ